MWPIELVFIINIFLCNQVLRSMSVKREKHVKAYLEWSINDDTVNICVIYFQAETIPLVQPFLETMTVSELHCLMTNGFATVGGSTLAVYILFGVRYMQ